MERSVTTLCLSFFSFFTPPSCRAIYRRYYWGKRLPPEGAAITEFGFNGCSFEGHDWSLLLGVNIFSATEISAFLYFPLLVHLIGSLSFSVSCYFSTSTFFALNTCLRYARAAYEIFPCGSSRLLVHRISRLLSSKNAQAVIPGMCSFYISILKDGKEK